MSFLYTANADGVLVEEMFKFFFLVIDTFSVPLHDIDVRGFPGLSGFLASCSPCLSPDSTGQAEGTSSI